MHLIPLIDRQQKVDTRTTTVNLEQQETITKDSVTIKVNAVLWFRIVDASKSILEVANYGQAVYQFSVTPLRNIIGQHSLDEVLKAREAEAIREKRARIVKAEAELEASIKLTQGAKQMEESPIALELRRMQMLSEIGIDNNTTTIVLIPSEFSQAATGIARMASER